MFYKRDKSIATVAMQSHQQRHDWMFSRRNVEHPFGHFLSPGLLRSSQNYFQSGGWSRSQLEVKGAAC